MTRLFKLTGLFILLLFIVGSVVIQTPIVQKKIEGWIVSTVNERTEGNLSLGSMRGIIPFRFKFEQLRYASSTFNAYAKEAEVILNPFALLVGHLSIYELNITHGGVATRGEGNGWPSLPISTKIHALQLSDFTYNEVEGIELTGSLSMNGDLSFNGDVTFAPLPDILWHASIEGDAESEIFQMIVQVKSPIDPLRSPKLDLWMDGLYDWKTKRFAGTMIGKGSWLLPWEIVSDITYQDQHLHLPSLMLKVGEKQLNGIVDYDVETGLFSSQLDTFDLAFQVDRGGDTISLNEIQFTSDNKELNGQITYKEGQLTFRFTSEVWGSGAGRFTFSENAAELTLQGENISWEGKQIEQLTFTALWKRGSPLDFDLAIQRATTAYELFTPLDIDLKGQLTENYVSFESMIWGLGSAPFTLSGKVPIDFSQNPFKLEVAEDKPLYITLQGEGSIDPLLTYLESFSLIARGHLKADLRLTGTKKQPQVSGYLIFDQGRVESLITGALYQDVYIEMEGQGRELTITQLIGRDFFRGELTGQGSVSLDYRQKFPFMLKVNAKRFTILATDPLSLNVDGEVTIEGDIDGVKLSGNARVREGQMIIPNKMPVTIPMVDVTYINPLPKKSPAVVEGTHLPLEVDLYIHMPGNLNIEGRGLVSEWRGDLHLFGEQRDLKYEGELKLVQGRYRLIGRNFGLTSGRIFIEGIKPHQITIDVKGDLELATLTASIEARGPLNDLRYTFSSSPEMSTNEILSWIIFNQGVSDLSPFQACRLANIIVSLSGKYPGPKIFSSIKDSLGLDVFDITNCDIDSADLTFQLGKYISQGTYVGVSKSISGDTDSVMIQTRLYRDFFLEGNYGGSLNGQTPNGGKMIFKWFKTY